MLFGSGWLVGFVLFMFVVVGFWPHGLCPVPQPGLEPRALGVLTTGLTGNFLILFNSDSWAPLLTFFISFVLYFFVLKVVRGKGC